MKSMLTLRYVKAEAEVGRAGSVFVGVGNCLILAKSLSGHPLCPSLEGCMRFAM